ncbi:MAG: acyl-CoA dehydrogenase family protein [Theionarchaea archaeon]|nr:acyl-CoA dehydrogenase family protein [Theionarchaea archaeon]
MVDFTLTQEQFKLQRKAREFALKEILPVVHYFDTQDVMPLYILQKAYEKGLMNLSIPKKYGGEGRALVDQAIVVEEISAACLGIATSLFDNSLGQEPLILSDNERVKETYLPLFTDSFKLISFATSEPTVGSDVGGIRCRAERDGKDWMLSGTKYWVSNGGYADYYTIFATTNPSLRHKGICAFLVDATCEGVTVGEPIPKMGLKTSNTVGIEFDHVRIPQENVLASPGEGFGLAMKTFSLTRPIIGAFATGIARSALEFAIHYIKKRKAFGQKIGDFQGIQFSLADMFQKVETARLLTLKAAWEADSGNDPTVSASLAKVYSTEAAFQVVSAALQICGGYGYTAFYPLEKLLRDARVLMIYEGTSEIQRVVISRQVMNRYTPVMPSVDDLPQLIADDPKDAAREGMKDQTVWRCRMCGYVHYGDVPPEKCPSCRVAHSAFNQVWPRQ